MINTLRSGSNEDDGRSPRISPSKMSKIGEEETDFDNGPAKQLYWNHDLLPIINQVNHPSMPSYDYDHTELYSMQ